MRSGLSLAGDLLGEEGAGEPAPGEVRIGAEAIERRGDALEPGRAAVEPFESRRELGPRLRSVEVVREPAYGPPARLERAVRVAAGCEQKHGAAPRGAELALREVDVLRGEEGEPGQHAVLPGPSEAGLEMLEQRTRIAQDAPPPRESAHRTKRVTAMNVKAATSSMTPVTQVAAAAARWPAGAAARA